MSELTDLIEAFFRKYPDDLALEWRERPRKPKNAADSALATAVSHLVTASERQSNTLPT